MNSLQSPCLHQHLYFCIDCFQPLCEKCILTNHFQHTLHHYNRNLQLIYLNNKHIKWLQHKEQQLDVLNKIIQFQIQEKINLNQHFINQHTIPDFLQIQNQVINSDHEQIIYDQIESIFITQQFINHNNFNLNNQVLTQTQWIQLSQQLNNLLQLNKLFFNFSGSSLSSLFIQQFIEWLHVQQLLEYLEIDFQNTNLDDSNIQLLTLLIQIPNLKYLEINVSKCNITSDSLVAFWLQYQQLIKSKYDYFYIYHHYYSFGHNINFEQEIMLSKASIYLDQNEITQ